MSFILDALKKSENERQRQTGPGFAAVPGSASGKPRRLWPVIVIALVAINLMVLAILLFRDDRASVSAPATTSQSQEKSGTSASSRHAEAVVSQTAGDEPRSGRQAPTPAVGEAAGGTGGAADDVSRIPPATVASARREVRGLQDEATASQPAPQADAGQEPTEAPPSSSAPSRDQPSASAQPALQTERDIPTANDLRLQGFLTGPPLHLDLHVYYPESHRRVVFISGAKYREGDQVGNGPVVREIVPEGVVLEERGQRYLLLPD